MRGGLLVAGTASDVGKTHVVTALCRLLARRGVSVAPFKAQNMSNNSFITADDREIGRAQGVQALAAGAEPEVAMNPILLKPTSDGVSQVVINGVARADLSARQYHEAKPELLGAVLDALAGLRARYDVVVAEGAGGAAEINLLDRDIVNLRIAVEAGLPALVVGDIDRGGVFAALYGTVALLPEPQRSCVKAFLLNKFRGDPSLLGSGTAELERRCGVPTLGVLPYVEGADLDTEDSVALSRWRTGPAGDGTLDVAVVRLPRISNYTDLDPLAAEPGVGLRVVDSGAALGDPDLIVIPGSKATVADLAWLRRQGLAEALAACRGAGTTILGICAGYQMLGRVIDDEVESRAGTVEGLGWLPVTTRFEGAKLTRRRTGRALAHPVTGYQIHHGRVTPEGGEVWLHLDDAGAPSAPGNGPVARSGEGPVAGGTVDGIAAADGAVLGTTLHGLFEEDGFRRAFLASVADRRGRAFAGGDVCFAAVRRARFDRLADLLEEHADIDRLLALIAGAG